MERLRKHYLTRQRSTQFQCLAYTFVCRHYLLGRGLLLPGCSCPVGKGRNHPVTEQTCSPHATTSQLWATPTLGGAHPLLVSSLIPTVPSLWCKKTLPSGPPRVSLSPSLADHWFFPMLLSYKQLCWGSWPQNSHAWLVFLLAPYPLFPSGTFLATWTNGLLHPLLPAEWKYVYMVILRKSVWLCRSLFQILLQSLPLNLLSASLWWNG